jgi:hypothetical protein
MKYFRLHADRNGKSHFGQATLKMEEADYRPPAPLAFVSQSFSTDALQFVRLPPGWVADSIHPPKKQFLIGIQGELEVTAGDGEKHTFGPGDSVLMEDVEGEGHRSRVKGSGEFVAAIVPVE